MYSYDEGTLLSQTQRGEEESLTSALAPTPMPMYWPTTSSRYCSMMGTLPPFGSCARRRPRTSLRRKVSLGGIGGGHPC